MNSSERVFRLNLRNDEYENIYCVLDEKRIAYGVCDREEKVLLFEDEKNYWDARLILSAGGRK